MPPLFKSFALSSELQKYTYCMVSHDGTLYASLETSVAGTATVEVATRTGMFTEGNR